MTDIEIMMEEVRKRQARKSLLKFTQYTYDEFEVNWHHALLCDYLDRFVRGEIANLMVNMPPQHGKSELVSRRLPAFLFGLNPNERIIACSYGDDLAKDMSRDVQRIIDTDDYRELFPQTTLNRSNVRTNGLGGFVRTAEKFEIVGHKGYYKCAGVGGGITGKGASVLILDDPYSNHEEANSYTIREKVWNWYGTTFMSRRSVRNLRQLIIQTRWHEDDLCGRLLSMPGKEKWTVLSLPAIAEDPLQPYDIRQPGEALWENRHPLEVLEQVRTTFGSMVFSAIWQQTPVPAGGGLFKQKDIRYAELNDGVYTLRDDDRVTHVNVSDCTRFTTADLATREKEGTDYTAILTWDMTPDKTLILVDMLHLRIDGAEHINLLWDVMSRLNVKEINIESVQYQITLLQTALKQGLPARELKADKDKVSRALPAAAKMEAHKIYLLNSLDKIDTIVNELTRFPKGKHDDIVDNFAYAAIRSVDIAMAYYMPQTAAASAAINEKGDERAENEINRQAILSRTFKPMQSRKKMYESLK